MTWVIGGKHLFCARAMSDVQITIPLEYGGFKYLNILQKVHLITPKITVLFAGSVRLALAIIEDLKRNYAPKVKSAWYAEPSHVANDLRRHINRSDEINRTPMDGQVQFLVFVAPNGTHKSFGMFKMVSPGYSISTTKEGTPFEIFELGSGSVLDDYRSIVSRHSEGVYFFDDDEGGKPNAVIPVGKVALEFAYQEALQYQNAGISKAMHITLVTHKKAILKMLPESPNLAFPQVADNWGDLCQLAQNKGICLASCDAKA
ncbi:hypothetical protein RIN61_08290 [Pseudomonas inefficax]|uniref:hypothetical protein n=1 Tax=Pseudomonas inefficax TaxID=2078786 RepID=UPI0028BDCF08|nr:hypothetical protein [Pseudomonas inefficax]WNN41286.1 hypothetical protein RIN61_08290 [Pseudomonas inefficax]